MPRAMDAIWRVGTECLNAPALCLSVAVCACRCLCRLCLHLSVSCRPMYTSAYDRPFVSVAALVCLCLPLSFSVCLSVRRQLHAPPLSHSPVSPLPLSRAGTPQPSRACCSRAHLCVCACVCVCVCVRACVRCVRCVACGLSAQDVVMQQTFFNILLPVQPLSRTRA